MTYPGQDQDSWPENTPQSPAARPGTGQRPGPYPPQGPYRQPDPYQQQYPPSGQYPPGAYPQQGADDYGYSQQRDPYARPDQRHQPEPQYGQPQNGQPQYGQQQYGQQQYAEPQYGQTQYGQQQYGQQQYAQPQYGQPQYDQSPYDQSPYAQPQYGQPQGGQPQYGQPLNGQPPYGQSQPYQPVAGEPAPRNVVAIVALVLGICGGWGFIGIGMAIGGIRRARRTGRGMAMSIIALVLCVVWLVVEVPVIKSLTSSSTPSASSTALPPGASKDPGCVAAETYANNLKATVAKDAAANDVVKLGADYVTFANDLTKAAALTKNPTAAAAMKKSAADMKELGQDIAHRVKPSAALSARAQSDATAVDTACGLHS